MARYAERNKFMQNLKTNKHGETTVSEVAIAFEKAETEVVPKSEFETLQRKYELAVAEREANVKAFTEELDKHNVMIQLLEGDISDRDKMLEAKVEEVYADFMRDYKCMREELDGLYDEYAEIKKKSKTELDILESTITQKEEEAYNRGYAEASKEILEEIEKQIDRSLSVITKILNAKGDRANGKTVLISKYDVFIEAKKSLVELKKKYTEQCPDCKHFVGCEKAVWHGLCEEYDKNTTEEKK